MTATKQISTKPCVRNGMSGSLQVCPNAAHIHIGHHDDVIEWKHFPCYWPFVRGIHLSSVNSLHIGQWRGALMLSLTCVRINGSVNNRDAGDLRRHRAHYDVIVMITLIDTKGNLEFIRLTTCTKFKFTCSPLLARIIFKQQVLGTVAWITVENLKSCLHRVLLCWYTGRTGYVAVWRHYATTS